MQCIRRHKATGLYGTGTQSSNGKGAHESLAPASARDFMKQKLRWYQESGICTNSDIITNSEGNSLFPMHYERPTDSCQGRR